MPLVGDDGLWGISSLGLGSRSLALFPREASSGRGTVREIITAGHWMCQGRSRSCPLRQRMWPGLRQAGDHQRTPEHPDSHTPSPHRLPGGLSTHDLEFHFPRGWSLSLDTVCSMS